MSINYEDCEFTDIVLDAFNNEEIPENYQELEFVEFDNVRHHHAHMCPMEGLRLNAAMMFFYQQHDEAWEQMKTLDDRSDEFLRLGKLADHCFTLATHLKRLRDMTLIQYLLKSDVELTDENPLFAMHIDCSFSVYREPDDEDEDDLQFQEFSEDDHDTSAVLARFRPTLH